MSAWSLHVPMVRALFDQVATPHQLQPLGLVEVLDWAAGALNRVDRESFFAQFEEHHAVQYFYEPFLQAFDPDLRKELGVWFTPPEIVQYMVARVDTVLREELDIEDGLADPRVYVLDPCCGTGSYLVEVLHRIAATLKDKGGDDLVAQDLKRAAMERIFGFEILPAPFVVAHLQLGILLNGFGSPLDDARWERVAVFLTNALTGWEPPKEPKTKLLFEELEKERDAADRVKRDTPILVILGNPPYNAFAGVSPAEEEGLVEPYKEGLISEWGIKKFNLDDLYVRFFRLAERRIADMTGQGIICYISNFSYLSDPSFVVMRRRFLREFDRIWIDCMNGDSRETGKLTPDGRPDPSVFSTQHNREGIRVGTAVCLLARGPRRGPKPSVLFRHFWGAEKRAELAASLNNKRFNAGYSPVGTTEKTRFSFRPAFVTAEYSGWPKVTELCAVPPINGLLEKRGGSLIDIDSSPLEQRMAAYLDPSLDWEDYKAIHSGLTSPQASFVPKRSRAKAQAAEKFDARRIVRYAVRPFDLRWCYYTPVSPIWNRARPKLWGQVWKGNSFMMTRPAGVASPEGVPFFFTTALGDNDFLRGHAYYFPIRLRNGERLDRKDEMALFRVLGDDAELQHPAANLSAKAREYLHEIGTKNPETECESTLLWAHVLAIGFSPAYLRENADGIRRDWPRVPLPRARNSLLASAKLGIDVGALLDPENPLSGVTSGRVRHDLRAIGRVCLGSGGAKGDLAVTAGWGHAGKGGVTMPGAGKSVRRAYTQEELAAIEAGARELGLSREEALRHLGESTLDIYLNGVAYWRNVPARVWDYRIGGYQVMKKWLSYRESDLLGRSLTLDEARYVTEMARRLAALVLLEPALDANYAAVKANAYPWPQAQERV